MKIKMNKGVLLGILKENMQKHEEEYEKAKQAYCAEMILEMQNKIAAYEKGEIVSLGVDLPTPKEYLENYNRVISMLSHDVHNEVELDEQQYANYVLDDWAWKLDFMHTNAFYSETR